VTPLRLVLLGWILLSGAWIFGNPEFAGPDERSHYLRALEVGRGHLITERRPDLARGENERQVEWNLQFTYESQVPAGLGPPDHECWTSRAEADAGCLDDHRPPADPFTTVMPVGNYQPLPYLLPGAAARAADSPGSANRLARILNALIALGLLYVALRMAWSPDAGPISLLGPVVAVTPMAIFCASMLNGSGPEIAAAIAFGAGLLRLRRDPSCARSPLVWAGIGAAGVVLSLTRTLGPAYLVLLTAAALSIGGYRPAVEFLRGRGRAAIAALVAIAVAIGLNRVWERAHGPEATTGFANLRAVLDEAVGEWWRASSELIGKFGYLEYRLPWIVYVAWFAAGFALVAAALLVARRRERIALAAIVAAALVLPMVMWIYAIRQTGFGLQGRYVLPALVAVPLVAGELIRAHAAELGERLRRTLVTAIPLTAAAAHLVAFYVFLGDAGWTPPLGWLPWLLAAAAGAALIASSSRRSPRAAPPPR
jgi:hypothetical protein